jgi:hypothetical protein
MVGHGEALALGKAVFDWDMGLADGKTEGERARARAGAVAITAWLDRIVGGPFKVVFQEVEAIGWSAEGEAAGEGLRRASARGRDTGYHSAYAMFTPLNPYVSGPLADAWDEGRRLGARRRFEDDGDGL